MKERQTVLRDLKNSNVKKVKVAVSDIDGILRGKFLHSDKFLSVAEDGFGFCNVVFGWDSSDVCYSNSQYTGWHTGYPDAHAVVDLSTYRKIPWENNTPFFLAEFQDGDGRGLHVCPRSVLKRMLKKADNMGVVPFFGFEYEWFNFQETPASLFQKKYIAPEPLTPGMFGYSILRSTLNQPYFTALMDDLRNFGIPLEGLHTETGPGVFEAAILFSKVLEASDRAIIFKTAVKEIAYRFQIMPSFMARWSSQLPGCGGHIHQSLWDKSCKQNLFYDAKDPHHMSSVFKSYLAGQMALLPELLVFLAPNINSYKRLVEGFWAPTQVSWGVDNRTTAYRVIPGSQKSTRLEVRVPGADANPYLAAAASLAAGLYGIENKLKLRQPPVKGSAYQAKGEKLPRTLQEATAKTAKSKAARQLLGADFVDHFVATREWEWKQFHSAVTNWELQRYFEII